MIKFLKFKINLRLFGVLFGVCLAVASLETKASTLYFLPQSQDVYAGDTFIVEARIDTEQKEVNAIEGKIAFPKNELKAADIIKGESAVGLWIKEPNYSNETGQIDFSGGIPGGFSGQGAIFKIIFSAIGNADSAEVFFENSSQVLLNDGKGTPDKLFFLEGSYRIAPKAKNLPLISSPSHPDPDKWHNSNALNLHWDLADGAEYSYILSRDSSAEPDEIADNPEGSLVWTGDMSYAGLEDGIYYFHLKQKLPGENWSEKASYRAMIDTISPENFTPQIAEIEGNKYLVFSALDKTSGVDRYEIIESPQNAKFPYFPLYKRGIKGDFKAEQAQNWKASQSPYLLADQSLQSAIKVKTVDKAGNERIAEIIPRKKQFLYWIIILILAAGIIIWKLGKRLKIK